MMYSVVVEYVGGEREVWDSGLSYQEAIDTIEALKKDDFAAAQSGAPVMDCHYWIVTDGKAADL